MQTLLPREIVATDFHGTFSCFFFFKFLLLAQKFTEALCNFSDAAVFPEGFSLNISGRRRNLNGQTEGAASLSRNKFNFSHVRKVFIVI